MNDSYQSHIDAAIKRIGWIVTEIVYQHKHGYQRASLRTQLRENLLLIEETTYEAHEVALLGPALLAHSHVLDSIGQKRLAVEIQALTLKLGTLGTTRSAEVSEYIFVPIAEADIPN